MWMGARNADAHGLMLQTMLGTEGARGRARVSRAKWARGGSRSSSKMLPGRGCQRWDVEGRRPTRTPTKITHPEHLANEHTAPRGSWVQLTRSGHSGGLEREARPYRR